MREYKTQAQSSGKKDPKAAIKYKVDGREVTAHRWGTGQYALYLLEASGERPADRLSATLGFFLSLFDQNDRQFFVDKLQDGQDPFGMEHITEQLNDLTEEWTGRPTGSSSGSTPSRSNAGRKSTPARRR